MKIDPHQDFLFKLADTTNLQNTRLFKGDENVISYQRQFTVTWICSYNMRWYPFDNQRCTMKMFSSASSVTLQPSSVTYSGPLELTMHYVKGVVICSKTINNKSGIVVEVYLGRPLFGTFLPVFMPTFIILVLSLMVRVFGRDHLEMVIEVNLILLLVFATLYSLFSRL